MANSLLINIHYGANMFDFMGIEVDWFPSNGVFAPDSDSLMNYRRTLSYQKPFGFLMNSNFDFMSHSGVELYFQYCLFYGND